MSAKDANITCSGLDESALEALLKEDLNNNDDYVVWALRDRHGKCLLTTYACTEYVAWIKFSDNSIEVELSFRQEGCTLTRHLATGPIPERVEL